MSRHELETTEGRRARNWGGGAFLGGIALGAICYIGYATATPDGTVVCSSPANKIEVCAPAHGEKVDWQLSLGWSGVVTVGGGISFLGSGALDRRLVVRRYADRVDNESLASWTPDIHRYMEEMPTAPPDVDYSGDD